jgi:Protein of unknown function (DUF1552)
MFGKRLNRRAMLRGSLATGAALALPLPILECMLNQNGTAYAQGMPLPKRYATWFFGNGILPPLWVPKATGADWQITEQLAPLANVKSHLTVVSGLANKFPGTAFHPLGSAASTTGGGVVDDSAVVPSIDQLVAAAVGKDSPFKSLELGVSNATPNGGQNTLHAVSHRGKNAPNYPEFDPHAVFARLFAQADATAGDIARLQAAKKSVLDAVLADGSALKGSLSSADQARLEQHLDGIRQLEMRLANTGNCKSPVDPTKQGILKDAKSEAPKDVNDVVAELLSVAFACDLTRSASLVFTLPAAHVYFRKLAADMNDDFHDTICHTDPGDNASQTRVNRGVIYTMQCLATLLEKLKALPEGDGNVLDNSLVYVTSCTSWGKVHDATDWPVLLAGKAGGALKGNLHVRNDGENLSKVLFSIANIMGAKTTSLGAAEGLVTSGVTGLT